MELEVLLLASDRVPGEHPQLAVYHRTRETTTLPLNNISQRNIDGSSHATRTTRRRVCDQGLVSWYDGYSILPHLWRYVLHGASMLAEGVREDPLCYI
jgi:hypothetical protein